ncbi:uncharacterized protein TRUGW13939_05319 [Talaromyces rugulosus]|uniref:Phosphoribosyltransferase domain-containing protein n=1 Tax=Talaromyces rugulosus TaxID=121627 RepID=A0A7H8QX45_TALRU|nr:uncharacterized protein TRUGW13939_05319 [Talaromyces rugulosus]QKX58198.1 hypothetical protein TRUGW13939_05319 [Talaromyces rugulosus]
MCDTNPSNASGANTPAILIGIYGLPGSGKTTMINDLKQQLDDTKYVFYEGSEVIDRVFPGGLIAFQQSSEKEKERHREIAINTIHRECTQSGKTGILAGHFMFWDNQNEEPKTVMTEGDLKAFSHILYLDVPTGEISRRRSCDSARRREDLPIAHLEKWKKQEKEGLQLRCRRHNILFMRLPPHIQLPTVAALIEDFHSHNEPYNFSKARKVLDEAINANSDHLETILVLDADRTLSAKDTAALFWDKALSSQSIAMDENPLKKLFDALRYSYTAFRQATLLYEEAVNEETFHALCQDVASETSIYAEFAALLRLVAQQNRVGAIVITSGLRSIWEKVIEKVGLPEQVKVIGGGRVKDGYVVTPAVKHDLVTRLQDKHGLCVWAFGDSPIDLPMLRKADRAIVVVGYKHERSKSMEEPLNSAINIEGLRAQQALLPSSVEPRLDLLQLPSVDLTQEVFLNSLFTRYSRPDLEFCHATEKNAAKMLMAQMRDARNKGPQLRTVHQRVGAYLATEYLTEVIGLEKYTIQHVQGYPTDGHRLLDESRTLIVALMRGGEPMALGINDVFPLAMFLHARISEDIKEHHLEGIVNVILVDSVVNTGKSVLEFVERIRQLHATVRIVVVAGVVQAQSVTKGTAFYKKLTRHTGYPKFHMVALRLSENKYSGRGGTDTGNRLFNTTQLE